jgi:Tfp pilus assembly protein FimT
MLNLLNTKLLVAILAVLVVIASTEVYRAREAHRTAEAAAKSAAILQQQQREAEERRKQDEVFRKQVEDAKKHHNSAAGNEGKTWTTYVP